MFSDKVKAGLAIVMLAGLTALLVAMPAGDAKVLRIGHNLVPTHPTHVALQQFASDVEARSNGKYKVKIYPNAILGDDSAMMEQLQGGYLHFMKASAGVLDEVARPYGVLAIPYLFEDAAHFHRAMGGEAVRPIYESGIGAGFVGLSYFAAGGRSFYTTDKPVLSPADLAGKWIRVMPSATSVRMVELLGARPDVMPYGDVYGSLRHGILDGAENNERALVDMHHGEVAKHFSVDNHAMTPDLLLANAKFWQGLPEGPTARCSRPAPPTPPAPRSPCGTRRRNSAGRRRRRNTASSSTKWTAPPFRRR